MRILRFVGGGLPFAFICATAFTACVADTSAPPVIVVNDEGGMTAGDDGGGSTDTDASQSSTTDGSTATDAGTAKVGCSTIPPSLFAATGAGPYCQGATGTNHCALGIHCCNDLTAGTHTCATTGPCSNPVGDVECFSKGECPSNTVCCGTGTPKTGLCPYMVVADFGHTRCETSCGAGEFQVCAGAAECVGGKACTPGWALRPGNLQTASIQVAACQ